MMDRRAFAALVTGAALASVKAWGQPARSKTVFYASVGRKFAWHDLDVEAATPARRASVTLPSNVQYAWPHPSRRFLYVV